MTFGNHSFDYSRVWLHSVNFSFSKVIPGHEEGRLEVKLLEDVQ